ncbi:Chromosome partition protein Smc [Carpediemonas membranifera]|uniref:Chromosome partition protein Smc n=1 Tax=Carpediemonas membranifera TaxID=201153 RepID=A0A8J6B5W9_9EUKA|nr:Chromosome partition protein Smc [Carpediemonas membranifera]|eukprot:KAG9396333.1 Chromosome partition protein Smc [Carpediemonas membranifera]
MSDFSSKHRALSSPYRVMRDADDYDHVSTASPTLPSTDSASSFDSLRRPKSISKTDQDVEQESVKERLLKVELKRAQKDLKESQALMQQEREKFRAFIASRSDVVDEMTAKLTTERENCSKERLRAESMEHQLRSLQREVSAIRAGHEKQRRRLEAELDRYHELWGAGADLPSPGEEIERLTKELEESASRLGEERARADGLADRVVEIESRLKERDDRSNDSGAAEAMAKQECAKLHDEIKKLHAEAEKTKIAQAESAQDKAGLEEACDTLIAENMRLQQDMEQLESRAVDLQNECARVRETVERDMKIESIKMQKEIDRLTRLLDEEREARHSDLAKFQSELKELNNAVVTERITSGAGNSNVLSIDELEVQALKEKNVELERTVMSQRARIRSLSGQKAPSRIPHGHLSEPTSPGMTPDVNKIKKLFPMR